MNVTGIPSQGDFQNLYNQIIQGNWLSALTGAFVAIGIPLIISLGLTYRFEIWGWKILQKGDRAVRERRGKPKRYFDKPGLVLWVKGWHNLRIANVNPRTVGFAIEVKRGSIGILIGSYTTHIMDNEASVKRSIYDFRDDSRGDLVNEARELNVNSRIRSAIGFLAEKSVDKNQVVREYITTKRLRRLCQEELFRISAEVIDEILIESFAQTEMQLIASELEQLKLKKLFPEMQCPDEADQPPEGEIISIRT